MHDTGVWSQLGTILAGIGTGILNEPDTSQVEGFLAENWDELIGESVGGMQGYKVIGRTEEMQWQPPVLGFKIERHGGTVLGSSKADMQYWEFDVVRCVANPVRVGSRQLRRMNPRLDIAGIAEEIVPVILERRKDPRLQWTRNGKVRILSDAITGEQSVPKGTLEGRRKRLRKEVLSRIRPHGWVANGSYYEFADIGT